jgi:uroporphyrinogen decarboxylase
MDDRERRLRRGLLIAPTHVLEPDVPWENIEALFEAVETYGVYED